MIQSLILETERLRLQRVDPRIFNELFSNYKQDEIISFFGFTNEQEYLKEKERFESGATMYNKSFLYFLIQEKESGITIGSCGFHTWYLSHNRAEIGYAISHEEMKRKGFMTEAIRRVIEYGFDEMHLNRIEAFIGPFNEPSIKLLERLGFTREGLLRQHYTKNGKAEDSLVFGLLRNDFQR